MSEDMMNQNMKENHPSKKHELEKKEGRLEFEVTDEDCNLDRWVGEDKYNWSAVEYIHNSPILRCIRDIYRNDEQEKLKLYQSRKLDVFKTKERSSELNVSNAQESKNHYKSIERIRSMEDGATSSSSRIRDKKNYETNRNSMEFEECEEFEESSDDEDSYIAIDIDEAVAFKKIILQNNAITLDEIILNPKLNKITIRNIMNVFCITYANGKWEGIENIIEEDRPKRKPDSSKPENQSSRAENDSPKAENASPKAENDSPKAENDSPKAENDSPKAENASGCESDLHPTIPIPTKDTVYDPFGVFGMHNFDDDEAAEMDEIPVEILLKSLSLK